MIDTDALGRELVAAAGRGERRKVASLLRRGVSVEARLAHGRTALLVAAENGHTDTVNALAGTYNANVDVVDGRGWTALMVASVHRHADAVHAPGALGASTVGLSDPDTSDLSGNGSISESYQESCSSAVSANSYLVGEDSEPGEQITCAICHTNKPKIRFHPCGHTACRGCSGALRAQGRDCHACRKPITRMHRVFL